MASGMYSFTTVSVPAYRYDFDDPATTHLAKENTKAIRTNRMDIIIIIILYHTLSGELVVKKTTVISLPLNDAYRITVLHYFLFIFLQRNAIFGSAKTCT